MDKIKLAVVGAHLEGMPLHWQLTSREATFCRRLHHRTELSPLCDGPTACRPKPALVHSPEGAAIALEVYELDMAAFGSFVRRSPGAARHRNGNPFRRHQRQGFRRRAARARRGRGHHPPRRLAGLYRGEILIAATRRRLNADAASRGRKP